MQIDKHISKLLYEHDCVIVPNLGGFVANYTPAKIHPTQHTFSPPSKKIVFNKNLNTNDGLLANCIVSAENTSYPEAINTINQFVSATNTQLKKGEKVSIEKVGTLHLDVEKNIQFTPSSTNYLLDAFGLVPFQSPAIKNENISKRIEKEFKNKDRDAIPLEKIKINIKRYVAIAILIPFIVGMIWIPLKTDFLKNVNYSNLNPFASTEVKTTIITKKVVVPTLKINVKKSAPLLVNNDTSSQSVAAAISSDKIIEAKADTTSVADREILNSNNLKFHLITGCFQIEENAINFVVSLKNQNLQASIIGKRGSLYVVSCGNYATRTEALDNLDQLHVNQPNAWLLKN